MKGKGKCYSAMPFRCFGDLRLTRADLAVLGVIAAHDRFQANGRGCDVKRDRLAYLADIDLATMSRSVRKLTEHGYIVGTPHHKDGRRNIYCVLYTDEDHEDFKSKTNPTDPERVRKKGKVGDRPATNLGDEPVTEKGQIGDIGNPATPEPASKTQNNIFPNKGNTSCGSGIDSAEASNTFRGNGAVRGGEWDDWPHPEPPPF